MKSQKKIFWAFLLNLGFSVLELVGGILTGSVAILSDAVHDFGDAASIGVSWGLEKKSQRPPDERFSYGYARFSAIGGLVTTLVLITGSVLVVEQAIERILHPIAVHYDGMIVLGVVGVVVNLLAAVLTHKGASLNQRAVNLHMLEDVLGWIVVLIGAVVMRFTGWVLLDPILSIGVAVFILVHAVRHAIHTVGLFAERVPKGVALDGLRAHVMAIEGVEDVHHLHVWSLDGVNHCATLHVVTDAEPSAIKAQVRNELAEHGVTHATLELERTDEPCDERECRGTRRASTGCCHHHH